MSRFHKSRLPPSIQLTSPWRRYRVPLIVAGMVAAGLYCSRSDTPAGTNSDYDRYHNQTFRVTRIVDGDTLDIDAADGAKASTRIRLWGVDTPEVSHHGKPSMHFGPEATVFAKEALEDRTVHVVLSPKRTRGKYGRLLAYVYLERGGRMFNELLLEQGMAYADLRFKHHYFDRFKTIEKIARKANTGLWHDVTPESMPPWKQRFETRSHSPP